MSGRLEPENIARQKARSDMVRAALLRAGDDGTAIRHVAHYAFPDITGRPVGDDAFRAALADRQFTIGYNATGEGMVLQQHREVASAGFDALIAELQVTMAGIGWEYDGWECAVAGLDDGESL